MKRIYATMLMALAVALAVTAVKPVDQAFPVKQPDGTTVTLYRHGDGRTDFFTTTDGYMVVRDSTGTLCYAELNDGQLRATTVVTHDIDERTADETTFIQASALTITDYSKAMKAADEQSSIQRVVTTTASDGMGVYGVSAGGDVESIGEITIPVIMLEYPDVSFQDTMTADKLSRFFNEEGYCEDSNLEVGSVRDYFVAQSRGLFIPSFDVVASVTVSNNRSYYGTDTPSQDYRAWNMVKEAVQLAVDAGVDFSPYEVDGVIPNVIVYYAGTGEATGGDDDTIWPHEGTLTGAYRSMGGYSFASYFVGNELYGTETYNWLMGMGVFVHEFGHVLGLPDFYDTTNTYSYDYPFGYWSVMDMGCYANTAYAPVGYSAYERSFMGWLELRELSDDGEAVTLGDPNDEDSSPAVFFRNPSDDNEYFILENRQPGTWYTTPAGLMVSRFAFNSNAWTLNTLNTTQSKKRAYMITADGSELASSTLSDSELYGNGINNKTSHDLYDGTTLSDMPVYKIINEPDGNVSFNFIGRDLIGTAVSNDDVYELVYDLDDLSSGDTIIFVNGDDAVAMTSTTQNTLNRAAVSVTIDDGEAYGNDAVQKYVALEATTGWGFYNASANVYLSAGNAGVVNSSKADDDCIAELTISEGTATVHFTGSAAYCYLGYSADDIWFTCYTDEISTLQLYRKTGTTGITSVKAGTTTTVDTPIYNIAGQYVGSSRSALPKGVYITDGKKFVVK